MFKLYATLSTLYFYLSFHNIKLIIAILWFLMPSFSQFESHPYIASNLIIMFMDILLVIYTALLFAAVAALTSSNKMRTNR